MPAPPSTQRRLPAAISGSLPPQRQAGFGLVEIAITLALSSVVIGVGYELFNQGDRARQISLEVENAGAMKRTVAGSYASAANFGTLNPTSALRDHLYPKSVELLNGQPVNIWGGPVLISQVPRGGVGGQGYSITYQQVPASVCARFAMAGAQPFDDDQVNGQSILEGKVPQPSVALALCTSSYTNTVQFISYRNGTGTLSNPDLVPCVVLPDETQPAQCPSGQISSVAPYSVDGITQGRSSFCNDPYGPVGWTPWTPIASTCAPICSAPPPAPQSATQPATCPAGQELASGSTTFTQTETRVLTYSCPAPTGSYSTSPGPWSPWSPAASAVCAPVCVAPSPGSQTQTQLASCPPGQAIASGAISFTQSQSRTLTYSCPSPTGPFTTTPGAWGAWAPAASTVCAPICSAPPPGSQSQTQPASCPTGQVTTSGASSFTQTQTRAVTYSCPSPTGPFATTPGAWGPWAPAVSSVCFAKCVAPAPGSQQQTLGCPPGQSGSIVQQRPIIYSCPAPTGSYTSTPGAWSTISNTCAATCANPSTSPVTIVSYSACSSPAPAGNASCTPTEPWPPTSGGPPIHGPNWGGTSVTMQINLTWNGVAYSCHYNSFLQSGGSTGGVGGSMSGGGIPGYSCGSVDLFNTSPGPWPGGLNILGPGPAYTSCP